MSTKSHATSGRHLNRLAMGEAAILSVPQAVALLPMADPLARRWLHDHDLVHDLAGRGVVIWADVLATIRGRETRSTFEPRRSFVRANLEPKE